MRSKSRWKVGSRQRTGKRCTIEVAVEHVDFSAIEVRGQKEISRTALQQCKALIDGPVRGIVESHHRAVGTSPVGDDAILGIEYKSTSVEIRRAVSDRASRAPRAARIRRSAGYVHYQFLLLPLRALQLARPA